MPKSKPPYPEAFKQQIVELAMTGRMRISGHRGRPFQPIVDGVSDERGRDFRLIVDDVSAGAWTIREARG